MMVKPATQSDDRYGTRSSYSNGPLDGDTRKAMNAAFEAMSEWRDEISSTTERNTTKVFEKMAAAAKAAGWPDYVVETAKSNLMQTTRMQLDMMDQVMDAWTEQMKSPGKLTLGNAFAKGFPGLPAGQGFGQPFSGFPQMDFSKFGFGANPMAPLQFWVEASQQWQKQWADAVSAMVGGLPGQPESQRDQGSTRKPTSVR